MLLYHLYWTEEFFSDDCDLNLKKVFRFQKLFWHGSKWNCYNHLSAFFFVVFENWNIEKCDWPKNMLFSWSILVLSGWIFYFHILKLKVLLLVKLKRQNYGQRNVPHYIHMSEYKIVMQFLESFNFIHLIQRELISKKWYILKLLQSYKQQMLFIKSNIE